MEKNKKEEIIIRKKIIISLPVIFLAWFIVTVFFYCQHYRVVKRYSIDKFITFNDVTVWIKEMSLENYRPGKKQQLAGYKAPWYFVMGDY